MCFGGEQVIKAEELVDVDGELNCVVEDKDKKFKYIQRYQDMVKMWNGIILRMQLGVEAQDKVHYAMPVRNMLLNAMSYLDQIRGIWGDIPVDEKKRMIGSAEYFSRFRKTDKICPVITLVFYSGDGWDGNLDLFDMFDLNGLDDNGKLMQVLYKFVPNYHINLFNPNNIKDISVFKTDLQMLLGVIKCKSNKVELYNYVYEHKDYFSDLDYDSVNVFCEWLNARNILKKDFGYKEEGNDMCKALEDLASDSREEGIEEGREQGVDKMSKLNVILIRENRLDDLIKASENEEYRKDLFFEYSL